MRNRLVLFFCLFGALFADGQLLYPHSTSDLTGITSANELLGQALPFYVPLYGSRYSHIWIHKDGYLTFNAGRPISHNESENTAVVAPFAVKQQIAQGVSGAGVYLRVVNLATEKNVTLRKNIDSNFRNGMIGAADFQAKFAIIVSWENLALANQTRDSTATNTYQVVLATDELRTYVMFNYKRIASIPSQGSQSAFVGFKSSRNSRTFELAPYSRSSRLSRLPLQGKSNNLPGRFIFQVDEHIWQGTCTEVGPNSPARMPLVFFPRAGNMLGGNVVNFTGPCLHPDSEIICLFENWQTKGVYRNQNQASCIAPPILYNGHIDLTVRVDGKSHFLGRYHILPPDDAHSDIVVVNGTDRQEEPPTMTIKWKSDRLSSNRSSTAQISLWGYRENGSSYPTLQRIDTLATGVLLSRANVTLDLKKVRATANKNALDYTLGFIAMNLTNTKELGNFSASPVIWSRPMPLSWYFKSQWEHKYGSNGTLKNLCKSWAKHDSSLPDFISTLPKCPCTLAQAQLAVGLFAPHPDCNVVDRNCDTFHKGALHCVQSGRSSVTGASQTCCYDDYGELLQTADSIYGGRPSRASAHGQHPFKLRNTVPVLSEYLNDKLPFMFCCKWQGEQGDAESCQQYNQRRPSDDCTAYQQPGIASIFGEPHILTFDGANYTFNGKGEFTLVNAKIGQRQFELQGRFEQMHRNDSSQATLNATSLTAIAVAENNTSTVEFRIRPVSASWRYKLDIIVDKEYIDWPEELSTIMQNFRGVSLYQPAGVKNLSHVIAMFDSGAGVEVIANRGHMSVSVYAPQSFLYNTRGLMGNYTKQAWNDLALPNGHFLPISSTSKMIQNEFARVYRVPEIAHSRDTNQHSSLFFHDLAPYSSYDDPSFQPEFSLQLPANLEQKMMAICGNSAACQFDFKVTLDAECAKITKHEEVRAIWLANESKKKAIRCPALPRPVNGRKSDNRYWPGTLVRFSCNAGFKLTGPEVKRCSADGRWSAGAETKCVKQNSN